MLIRIKTPAGTRYINPEAINYILEESLDSCRVYFNNRSELHFSLSIHDLMTLIIKVTQELGESK